MPFAFLDSIATATTVAATVATTEGAIVVIIANQLLHYLLFLSSSVLVLVELRFIKSTCNIDSILAAFEAIAVQLANRSNQVGPPLLDSKRFRAFNLFTVDLFVHHHSSFSIPPTKPITVIARQCSTQEFIDCHSIIE